MKTRHYHLIVAGIVMGAGLALQADAKPAADHGVAPPSGMAFSIPTDSFLHAPVNTVKSLVHQVKIDPAACGRYAKYLNIPADSVASYFKDNVVVSQLKKADNYTVYMVRANGLVYPVVMSLDKGTRVFTRNGGEPVLMCDTGNPLKLYETAVEVQTIIKTHIVEVPGPPIEKVIYLKTNDVDVPFKVVSPIYKARAVSDTAQGNSTPSEK